MHKRQKSILAASTSSGIRLAFGRHPALWSELIGVGAPLVLVPVRACDGDDDAGFLGHEMAEDRGVAGRGARGHGNGRPVAEDLVAEGVQERHLVDVRTGDVGVAAERAWEAFADFGAETGLPVGVHAHHVDRPGDTDGDCLVAGCEEGHHLVYHTIFSDLLALDHDAEDVDVGQFFPSQLLLLDTDHIAAGRFDRLRGVFHGEVAFDGDDVYNPSGNDAFQDRKYLE